MTTVPLATLFRSAALREAFAKGAADAMDAFLVPVGITPRKPLSTAVEARRPRPVLAGGAAAVRNLELA